MIDTTLPEFDKDLFDFRADYSIVQRDMPVLQQSYLLWLKELSGRTDVEIDESIYAYLKHTDQRAFFVTPADFNIFDLIKDADTHELALGLPEDEPAELWLPLLLVDHQEYDEDGGHLAPDHENVFHLHGSDILIVEGKPRKGQWALRMQRLTDDIDFQHGTRFFRCSRIHTPC